MSDDEAPDLDEVMPDPDAEDDEPAEVEEEPVGHSPEERAKLNKQIAAQRFKIANPKKFNRNFWEPEDLERHEAKLADLIQQRGKTKRGAPSLTKPRVKRGPDWMLAERKGCMLAFTPRDEKGGRLVPTIEDLMSHATKNGSEMVVETAIELGYSHDSCVRLMDHCDRAEAAAYRKLHPRAPAMRFGDSDKRVGLLMGES
jgi:hypothetical protein